MRLILTLLLLTGMPACRRSQEAPKKGETVVEARSYEVTKKGRLVLTVTDAPGPIVSTALRPPDGKMVKHPFLSASAYAPEEEDALRQLLEKSQNTRDFLARLRKAGYEVAPR